MTYEKGHEGRIAKLERISEFDDDYGHWIVCKDQKGREWTVKDKVFEEFRFSGFPYLREEVEAEIHKLMSDKHYPEMSRQDRYTVIRQLLELATHKSLSELFPNL
jgi:hypothetical protein